MLCKSSGFFVLFWFWVFRVFFSRIISFQFMVTLENISFVKEQHVTDYILKILLAFFQRFMNLAVPYLADRKELQLVVQFKGVL